MVDIATQTKLTADYMLNSESPQDYRKEIAGKLNVLIEKATSWKREKDIVTHE